ncbi:MAG TPA: hypothetical protein VF384_16880 [Planctomycetota bacterium]
MIAVPAVLTLAITVLRFTGEVVGWDPRWFGREAGGGAALVGIGWLVPVFGAFFAWQLVRAGKGPASPARALGTMSIGLGVVAIAVAIVKLLIGPTPTGMLVGACGALACAAFVHAAWPELGRVNVAYAVLARLPVAALTFVDVLGDLGTHYGKLAPGSAPVGDGARIGLLVLAQAVFWVPFTLLGGGLAGAVVALLLRRRPVPANGSPADG